MGRVPAAWVKLILDVFHDNLLASNLQILGLLHRSDGIIDVFVLHKRVCALDINSDDLAVLGESLLQISVADPANATYKKRIT